MTSLAIDGHLELIISYITLLEILTKVCGYSTPGIDSYDKSNISCHTSWECYIEDTLEQVQGPQEFDEYLREQQDLLKS